MGLPRERDSQIVFTHLDIFFAENIYGVITSKYFTIAQNSVTSGIFCYFKKKQTASILEKKNVNYMRLAYKSRCKQRETFTSYFMT